MEEEEGGCMERNGRGVFVYEHVHVCRYAHACMHTHTYTDMHVSLDFKGKQSNKPESPLFYFIEKKASQGGFEPMTSCFRGSRSTN